MAARKRLALVAFERGEGPWNIAKGNESAVVVHPVLAGEEVTLEVDGQIGKLHCPSGLTPIKLRKGDRFRFVKTVPQGVTPSRTCVELIVTYG